MSVANEKLEVTSNEVECNELSVQELLNESFGNWHELD